MCRTTLISSPISAKWDGTLRLLSDRVIFRHTNTLESFVIQIQHKHKDVGQREHPFK